MAHDRAIDRLAEGQSDPATPETNEGAEEQEALRLTRGAERQGVYSAQQQTEHEAEERPVQQELRVAEQA